MKYHPFSALPPDAKRVVRKIGDLGINLNLAVLTFLVLLDEAIGDKVSIVGHPEATGVSLEDTFPRPELLDAAHCIPSVAEFIAGIEPPSRPMRLSPEAERLFNAGTQGEP